MANKKIKVLYDPRNPSIDALLYSLKSTGQRRVNVTFQIEASDDEGWERACCVINTLGHLDPPVPGRWRIEGKVFTSETGRMAPMRGEFSDVDPDAKLTPEDLVCGVGWLEVNL